MVGVPYRTRNEVGPQLGRPRDGLRVSTPSRCPCTLHATDRTPRLQVRRSPVTCRRSATGQTSGGFRVASALGQGDRSGRNRPVAGTRPANAATFGTTVDEYRRASTDRGFAERPLASSRSGRCCEREQTGRRRPEHPSLGCRPCAPTASERRGDPRRCVADAARKHLLYETPAALGSEVGRTARRRTSGRHGRRRRVPPTLPRGSRRSDPSQRRGRDSRLGHVDRR